MNVTLRAELKAQVEQEHSHDEIIETAIRRFLGEGGRSKERFDGLRRIGDAVDRARLYECVLIPDLE